jgi:hypothetical protein
MGREPGVTAASIIDAGAWGLLALDNDKRLTLDVAIAIAVGCRADVLRVRLTRSRRLRIEHIDAAGRLLTEARWPEREGASPLLDVGRWPVATLAEPVLEHLAAAFGLPAQAATVPPRGWAGVGLRPRSLKTVDEHGPPSPLASEGPVGRIALGLHAHGPLAALVVLAKDAPDPALPDIVGLTCRRWPSAPRWGDSGRRQVSARVTPGADPSAAEALVRWIAGSGDEIVQAVLHASAWDPMLQVEVTPWELVWGAPPIAERDPGWPEAQIRGAGDAIACPSGLLGALGDPPDGSRRQGRLIHRDRADVARWHRWLAPAAQRPGG